MKKKATTSSSKSKKTMAVRPAAKARKAAPFAPPAPIGRKPPRRAGPKIPPMMGQGLSGLGGPAGVPGGMP